MIELVNFLDEKYENQFETLSWRNSEHVAEYFKISKIAEEIHVNWLKSLHNKNPRNIAFFIKSEENYVGVTYFHSINYADKMGDWGIYIHEKNQRGKGIGKKALYLSLNYAKDILRLDKIFLDALNTNKYAISVYKQHGFKLIGKNSIFLRFEKEL